METISYLCFTKGRKDRAAVFHVSKDTTRDEIEGILYELFVMVDKGLPVPHEGKNAFTDEKLTIHRL